MPKPNFIIAPPNPGKIIGRTTLLASIDARLREGRTLALVHGIGGIGKTTAACAYAHHSVYQQNFDHVCWLEVTTTIPRAFCECSPLLDFLGIGDAVLQILQTPMEGNPSDHRAYTHIVETLRTGSRGEILLILDNANNRDELHKFLPALDIPGLSVLVTSRSRYDDAHTLPVESLDPPEAALLFRRHYLDIEDAGPPETADEDSLLQDLFASFDYHTLLIEMLGKIARNMRYELPELLKYVRELTLREEDWQIEVGTGQSGRTHRMPSQTAAAYIRHLFRELKDLDEADLSLLRKLTALPNKTHTKEQLAKLFALEGKAVLALQKQLAALDRRGIPLSDENKGWRLHPLFREVCLEELKPFTVENLEPLFETVAEMINIVATTREVKEKFENIPYAELVLNLVEDHNYPAISYFKDRLASIYRHLARFQESEKLSREVLDFDLKYFGEDHSDVAVGRSHLARTLHKLGDLEGAKNLHELALASSLKNYGEGHPHVAIYRNNLAMVLRQLGDLHGAKKLYDMSLESDLKNFGNEHPNVARVRNNLALVLKDLGDMEGAKKLYELALESDLKNFGDVHPDVAIDKFNLAFVIFNLGDQETAISLWLDALNIYRLVFGEQHPDTQSVLRQLKKLGVTPPNSNH